MLCICFAACNLLRDIGEGGWQRADGVIQWSANEICSPSAYNFYKLYDCVSFHNLFYMRSFFYLRWRLGIRGTSVSSCSQRSLQSLALEHNLHHPKNLSQFHLVEVLVSKWQKKRKKVESWETATAVVRAVLPRLLMMLLVALLSALRRLAQKPLRTFPLWFYSRSNETKLRLQ